MTGGLEPSEAVAALARRHGFSPDAVWTLIEAFRAGGGRSAQWTHPDLGGPGQWLAGGLLQIGAMGDHALKARVAALLADLAAAAA